jgi:hypothetical protein
MVLVVDKASFLAVREAAVIVLEKALAVLRSGTLAGSIDAPHAVPVDTPIPAGG